MQKLPKLVPKDKADQFGVLTALVLQGFVTVNNLIGIYSNLVDDQFNSILILIFGLFILYNTLGNMFKAMSVDSTIDSIEVQIKQLPEWGFCSICEQYSPPRSFHCFTCNKCILKRHNHCLFLGNLKFLKHNCPNSKTIESR